MSQKDKNNIRIHVPMPQSLLDVIDSYWHDKKLISRAEAMRQLLKDALRAKGYDVERD